MSRPSYQFAQHEVIGSELLSLSQKLRPGAVVDERRAPCRVAAFTLCCPGNPLLLSFVEGVSGNITSQIAVQLSHDAIAERALEFACELSRAPESLAGGDDPLSLRFVREALKAANTGVYEYSHRMAAGGQVSATGFVASFDGVKFGLGQVGSYETYVWRSGQLEPFYDYSEEVLDSSREGILRRFIGANAQILVDLAAVNVRQGDIVVLTSMCREERFPAVVERVLSTTDSLADAAVAVASEVARLCLIEGEGRSFAFQGNALALLVRIGKPFIELKQVCYHQ